LREEHRRRLVEIARRFRLQEVSPASSHQLEGELAEALRELGRQLTERSYNSLEPEQAEQMPHHVHYEAGGYRRRNDKTRNTHAAAALRARSKLSPTRDQDYRRTYHCLRRRTKFLQYAEYQNLHLPLASGVTEGL
jgi:hypothetical protein